jgi:hypothetical protein
VIHNGLAAPDRATIELSGELGIREVGDLHARLTLALQEDPVLVATIDENAVVDLSFVQLLESARRTADQSGGSFSLTTPATGELLQVLQRGGFIQSAQGRAFWLNESGYP